MGSAPRASYSWTCKLPHLISFYLLSSLPLPSPAFLSPSLPSSPLPSSSHHLSPTGTEVLHSDCLSSLDRHLDIAKADLRRESQLKNCQDQTGLWPCLWGDCLDYSLTSEGPDCVDGTILRQVVLGCTA